MISKLSRSSFIGVRSLTKSLWAHSSFDWCTKNGVICVHKSYKHSHDSIIESMDTISNDAIRGDIWIPEIPMLEDNAVISLLTEPSFASLGLNNYSPPGLIQYILENVHVSFGLPWWACVGITAVLLRSSMLPVMINQRRTLVKYQTSMVTMSNIILEAMNAKESGNSILMMIKIKEFSAFIENQSLSILSVMKPMLIQAPVFLSVFMALRGMAEAPVTSLKTGGLSWFIDLTIYDPYYILPLITAVSLAIVMETGVEAPTPQGKTMRWVFRCIPPVLFVIICHFPSTLLLYWTCSNMFSLVFAFLLKLPDFKKALNIPDMPIPANINNANHYGIKEAMELLRSLQEVELRHKAERMRWTKENQQEILSKGISAANERIELKKGMKTAESSSDEPKDKV